MRLYYALSVCVASAALTGLLALHAAPVSAESSLNPIMHSQVSELMTMAIPPYKRCIESDLQQ